MGKERRWASVSEKGIKLPPAPYANSSVKPTEIV